MKKYSHQSVFQSSFIIIKVGAILLVRRNHAALTINAFSLSVSKNYNIVYISFFILFDPMMLYIRLNLFRLAGLASCI